MSVECSNVTVHSGLTSGHQFNWGMKEIVSVSLFYVVKSPNFNAL
jgi:hypothetical protein